VSADLRIRVEVRPDREGFEVSTVRTRNAQVEVEGWPSPVRWSGPDASMRPWARDGARASDLPGAVVARTPSDEGTDHG